MIPPKFQDLKSSMLSCAEEDEEMTLQVLADVLCLLVDHDAESNGLKDYSRYDIITVSGRRITTHPKVI